MIKLFEEYLCELRLEKSRPDKINIVIWNNGNIYYDISDLQSLIGNRLVFKYNEKNKTLLFNSLDDRSEIRFIHLIQQALKDFIRINLIDKSWKIQFGFNETELSFDGYNDVESILKYDFSFNKYIPFIYHGTSSRHLENIKKYGLTPNIERKEKIHNYDSLYREDSDENIYLSIDYNVAKNYAENSVASDWNKNQIKSKPIIIEFRNIPIYNVKSDDDFINQFSTAKILSSLRGKILKNDSFIQSIRFSSQFAIKGRIPASMIEKIHYL